MGSAILEQAIVGTPEERLENFLLWDGLFVCCEYVLLPLVIK